MFTRIASLRESFLTARLLREEILAAPVPPQAARRLRDTFRVENASGRNAVVDAALRLGRMPGLVIVDRSHLEALAAAAGSAAPRSSPGVPFRGTAAPPPAHVPGLLGELLETVNAPAAIETWPAPARAIGLDFLLRLVQPFEAPGDVVAHGAEAMLLAADGFAADSMLLPEVGVGAEPGPERADPDAFLDARVHRLVDRLGESLGRLRDVAARSLLAAWAPTRPARLNRRQAAFVRRLAEDPPARPISFQDYVSVHAGRHVPSLRTLQRDWQTLRDRGLLRSAGDGWALGLGPVTFGG